MSNMSDIDSLALIAPYKNSEHCRKAFQVLNVMRQQDVLCDVTVKAGNREIRAHRVVLASASSYFYAMFTGDLSESRQDTIILKEIDTLALEKLVEYCYTSEVQVTEDNVQVYVFSKYSVCM